MKKHYKIKDLSFLTFFIGKEQFAVNVDNVIEVVRDINMSEVPKTEHYIEGIINFRGEIVTIVNTAKKINLKDINEEKKKIIIVFELKYEDKVVRVGTLVDKVKKVFNIPENLIKPVPDFGSYYNPEFLEGALNTEDGFIMILDINKIFSTKDVEILIQNNNHTTAKNK